MTMLSLSAETCWINLVLTCIMMSRVKSFDTRSVARPCSGRICDNHTCLPGKGNPIQCQCLQGYRWNDKHDDCNDVDECANHFHDPCGHRGRCVNSIGSYRCDCLSGWQGTDSHCATNVTGPNPPCMPGYHGDMCKDGVCGQHGYAQPTDGDNFVCICRPGWTHNAPDKPCDVDINECLDNSTCQHGASCDNTPGHYQCHCGTGWIGKDCTVYNCTVKPCANGGTCINSACHCAPGWTGQDCATRDCIPSCKNAGVCISETCHCTSGYTGSDCSTRMCNPSCKNGGQCVNGICRCSVGYTGTDCSTMMCHPACANNGRCANGICQCSHGWSGQSCSQPAIVAGVMNTTKAINPDRKLANSSDGVFADERKYKATLDIVTYAAGGGVGLLLLLLLLACCCLHKYKQNIQRVDDRAGTQRGHHRHQNHRSKARDVHVDMTHAHNNERQTSQYDIPERQYAWQKNDRTAKDERLKNLYYYFEK